MSRIMSAKNFYFLVFSYLSLWHNFNLHAAAKKNEIPRANSSRKYQGSPSPFEEDSHQQKIAEQNEEIELLKEKLSYLLSIDLEHSKEKAGLNEHIKELEEKNYGLRKDLEDLNEEITIYEQENEELSKNLAKEKTENNENRQRYESTVKYLSEKSDALDSLTQQYTFLENQYNLLKNQPQKGAQTIDTTPWEKRILELQEELKNKIKKHKKEIQKQQATYKKNIAEMEEFYMDNIKEKNNQIAAMAEELKNLDQNQHTTDAKTVQFQFDDRTTVDFQNRSRKKSTFPEPDNLHNQVYNTRSSSPQTNIFQTTPPLDTQFIHKPPSNTPPQVNPPNIPSLQIDPPPVIQPQPQPQQQQQPQQQEQEQEQEQLAKARGSLNISDPQSLSANETKNKNNQESSYTIPLTILLALSLAKNIQDFWIRRKQTNSSKKMKKIKPKEVYTQFIPTPSNEENLGQSSHI